MSSTQFSDNTGTSGTISATAIGDNTGTSGNGGGAGDARGVNGALGHITKVEVASCSRNFCKMSRRAITSMWFAACVTRTSAISLCNTPTVLSSLSN